MLHRPTNGSKRSSAGVLGERSVFVAPPLANDVLASSPYRPSPASGRRAARTAGWWPATAPLGDSRAAERRPARSVSGRRSGRAWCRWGRVTLVSTFDIEYRYGMDLVRDFHRGAVRLHVLFHAKSEDVFGAAIAMEIARHGHSVSPGTLYPLLHDLEASGDLTSTTVVVGGHRRRCYRITPQGRRTLEACTAALRELADEVLEP